MSDGDVVPRRGGSKEASGGLPPRKHGGATLDNQRADIKRALRVRRLRQAASFEEHVSAAKARPEFDAMMEAAHRGEFDVIVVWALDRFGRGLC